MEEPMTNPRHVVRKGSLTENLYLQKDGTWGRFGTAKRFRSQEAADEAGAAAMPNGDYGLFPCSKPRRLRKR